MSALKKNVHCPCTNTEDYSFPISGGGSKLIPEARTTLTKSQSYTKCDS